MQVEIRDQSGRRKECVAFLCLIDNISKDEGISSRRGQSGLLLCDYMRTIRVGNICDNGFRGHQNERVRVVQPACNDI
jgi:hypothetical protein